MANIVEIIIRGIDKTREGFLGPIKNVDDLGKRLDQLKPIVLAAGAAVAAAGIAMARQFLIVADETAKTSQKIGISVESLSAWRFAAGLAGVSSEGFTSALARMSRSLVEAATHGGQTKDTLDAMGISLLDGHGKLKTTEEILLSVSDVFSKHANGITKTAAAQQLFGKAGAELIPLLNQGSNALREQQNQARALGVVISSEAAVSAEHFNDALTKLKKGIFGIVGTVVSEFLPAMAAFAESLVESNQQSGVLAGTAGTIIDIFKVLRFVVEGAINGFKALSKALILIGDALGGLFAAIVSGMKVQFDVVSALFQAWNALITGQFTSAQEIAKAAFVGIRNDLSVFGATVKGIGTGVVKDWQEVIDALSADIDIPELGQGPTISGPKGPKGPEKPQLALPIDAGELQKQNDAATKSLNALADLQEKIHLESLRGLEAETAAVEARFAKQVEEIGKVAITEEDSIALLIASRANMEQRLTEINLQESEKRQELRQTEMAKLADLQEKIHLESLRGLEAETAAVEERFAKQVEEIGKLNVTEEDSIELVIAAHSNMQQRLTEIAKQQSEKRRQIQQNELSAISGIFGNLANVAKAFGKKGFAVWKAFASAQAIVSAYTSANRAMAELPWPLNLFAAAATLAAGLANVKVINSTEPPAAHGGLTFVPAESTYILQRGERVLSPNQNRDVTDFISGSRNGGADSGGPTSITILLDGDVLARGIGRLTRDGRLSLSAAI